MVCGSGVSSSAAMTAKVEGTSGCKCGFESLTSLFCIRVFGLIWIWIKDGLHVYAGPLYSQVAQWQSLGL